MENRAELSPTFPYPQREVEISKEKLREILETKPIELTKKERKRVSEFEGELFEQYLPLENIAPETHAVYPQYFLSDTGWRLFQMVYQDSSLSQRIEKILEEQGVKFDEESVAGRQTEKTFWNAVFKDLLTVAEDEEKFTQYQEKGWQFKEGEKALGKKASLTLSGEITASAKPTTLEEAEKLFYQISNHGLKNIQKQLRKGVETVSSDWARDRFLEEFQKAGGNVDQITNPVRISRVVDPEKLLEKIKGYRNLKKEWKELKQELLKNNDPLSQAEATVLNIYLRRLNISIAEQYSTGRVIASSPCPSPEEKEAYRAIKGTRIELPEDRFNALKASRTMERIDHFLVGASGAINPNTGLYETISLEIDKMVAKAEQEKEPENPNFEKYNAVRVNAEQAKVLGEIVLRTYHLDRKGWTIYIDPQQKSLACAYKETFEGEEEKIKQIKIPPEYNRGLIDTLKVLAHEIEGHALRWQNQETFLAKEGEGMRLFSELTTGREDLLSEAAAIYMEEETLGRTVGKERFPKYYYYKVLKRKKDGGSFKECFQAFMEAFAEGKGQSLAEIIDDSKKFEEAWRYVYSRTLRIFREGTPLGDTSGYLPTSKTLHYVEQEIIGEELEKAGLIDLLFTGGVDFYSLADLRKLGLLDFDKMNKPKYAAVALFEKIKAQIDRGKTLEEIIGTSGNKN